jgi:hypothetical protein
MNDEWGATVYQVRDSETRQERKCTQIVSKSRLLDPMRTGTSPVVTPMDFIMLTDWRLDVF